MCARVKFDIMFQVDNRKTHFQNNLKQVYVFNSYLAIFQPYNDKKKYVRNNYIKSKISKTEADNAANQSNKQTTR